MIGVESSRVKVDLGGPDGAPAIVPYTATEVPRGRRTQTIVITMGKGFYQ